MLNEYSKLRKMVYYSVGKINSGELIRVKWTNLVFN